MSDAIAPARTDVDSIVAAIARVIGRAPRPVELHEPRLQGRERDYATTCIDSGWVSSAGWFVEAFEARLAEVCGTRYAVATVSGTAGLHAGLHVVGVQPGDEVIVPSLTFVATANAAAYCGAVPHFVDCQEHTFGLDPGKLAKHLGAIAARHNGETINRLSGRPIRAVVPVHVLGHAADMDALSGTCAEFGLPIVEDATEALGSTHHGQACGAIGAAGILSFNGNKIVTSGGGGAIVTDDEALAARTRHLTTTARLPHAWALAHDEIGWNYRLPAINAALGLAQLEQLGELIAAKRHLAQRYADAFVGIGGVRFVSERPGTVSNYWLNAIMIDEDSEAAREAVLSRTNDAGFRTRPAWTPLHRLAMFRDCPRADLSTTESVQRRLVCLPSSASLALQ